MNVRHTQQIQQQQLTSEATTKQFSVGKLYIRTVWTSCRAVTDVVETSWRLRVRQSSQAVYQQHNSLATPAHTHNYSVETTTQLTRFNEKLTRKPVWYITNA